MSLADRFDHDAWLARIRAAEGRRVLCAPGQAQLAAEHCYGRRFAVQAYMPETAFSACLIAPDGARVTGGQARGPFAIVPELDTGVGRLVPALWHQSQPESPWLRLAAFTDALCAKHGAVALALDGTFRKAGGAGGADEARIERVLMAKGMVPGRIAGGALGLRVYGWRRG